MSWPKNYNKRGILAVKIVVATLEMTKGRHVDSIARPTSLGKIQTVTMEELSTYGTPGEPSE